MALGGIVQLILLPFDLIEEITTSLDKKTYWNIHRSKKNF